MATASEAMSKQELMDLVERTILDARKDGKDLTPSEIHDILAPEHPEIAEMSKPRFSGGIVRMVKQKLNKAQNGSSSSSRGRTVNGSSRAVRIDTQNGESSDNADYLRVVLFDFASEFIHAENTADRIARLQDSIETYVDRLSEQPEVR